MASDIWFLLSIIAVSVISKVTRGTNQNVFIKATSDFEVGLDQLDIECRPPTSWSSVTSTVFAIQLMKNTTQTSDHNIVFVSQKSTTGWQDISVRERAIASGQLTNVSSAFLKMTIPAGRTEQDDVAKYTCRVAGLINGTLKNLEASIYVGFNGPRLCPKGWKNYNTSCYHVNREPASWIEAEKMCELHGGSLVHIQSDDEQLFLQNLLHTFRGADPHNDYWVGGTDWSNEGTWVWEPDGTTVTYTNWFPGQPNNGRYPGHDVHEPGYIDENCLLLRYSHNFKWIDTVCNKSHFYICENGIRVSTTTPRTTTLPPIVGK